jgi:CBS domain-containing protein
MTSNPRTCGPNDSLRDAIQVMKDENVGITPVTEGNGENRVVGVVTDRDASLKLCEVDRRPSDVRVSEAMTARVVQVRPDDGVDEVTRRMEDEQVRRILVCEDGRLLGVISTADLARDGKRKQTGKVMEKISEPAADASH